MNMISNVEDVVVALSLDFVNEHRERRLLHSSLKQEIQHRVSGLYFILCRVVLCIKYSNF